jgi:hypothetical protein
MEPERLRSQLENYIGKTPEEVKKLYPNLYIRVLKPGSCYTMEYMPSRINLHVDDKGIITSVVRG